MSPAASGIWKDHLFAVQQRASHERLYWTSCYSHCVLSSISRVLTISQYAFSFFQWRVIQYNSCLSASVMFTCLTGHFLASLSRVWKLHLCWYYLNLDTLCLMNFVHNISKGRAVWPLKYLAIMYVFQSVYYPTSSRVHEACARMLCDSQCCYFLDAWLICSVDQYFWHGLEAHSGVVVQIHVQGDLFLFSVVVKSDPIKSKLPVRLVSSPLRFPIGPIYGGEYRKI